MKESGSTVFKHSSLPVGRGRQTRVVVDRNEQSEGKRWKDTVEWVWDLGAFESGDLWLSSNLQRLG